MGIFDNAKSILIGSKEVKSIVIGEGTVYEKEVTPQLRDLSFTLLKDGSPYPDIRLGFYAGSSWRSCITGSAGGCTISDVPDGTYQLVGDTTDTAEDRVLNTSITVDATHTSFEFTVNSQ